MTPGPWLTEAVATGDLSRVTINHGRSADLIGQAAAHVNTVRAVAPTDRTAAVSLCHDAVRKSIDAHAGARGYRFENTPGAHKTRLAYAMHELRAVIPAPDLELAETLRRRRHSAEYGEIPSMKITDSELQTYAALAERTTATIKATLPGLAAPQR